MRAGTAPRLAMLKDWGTAHAIAASDVDAFAERALALLVTLNEGSAVVIACGRATSAIGRKSFGRRNRRVEVGPVRRTAGADSPTSRPSACDPVPSTSARTCARHSGARLIHAEAALVAAGGGVDMGGRIPLGDRPTGVRTGSCGPGMDGDAVSLANSTLAVQRCANVKVPPEGRTRRIAPSRRQRTHPTQSWLPRLRRAVVRETYQCPPKTPPTSPTSSSASCR